MQRISSKRNIILLCITVLAALILCAALLPFTAKAEGNNAGFVGNPDKITVNFDVNGKDANDDGQTDESLESLNRNNEAHYKKRYISTTAVQEKLGLSGAGFTFIDGTVIQTSESFKVEYDTSSWGRIINVTALSRTLPAGEYFTIDMQAGATRVNVCFNVVIDETFRQLVSSGASSATVGYTLDARGENEVYNGTNMSSYDPDSRSHAAIATISNYEYYTLSLDDILKGRALYSNDVPFKNSNGTFWVLDSVHSFTIKSVSFPNITANIFTEQIISNSTRSDASSVFISSSVTGKLVITSSTVGESGANFWGRTHNMQINLGLAGNQDTTYIIIVPVRFAPANPQRKNVTKSALRLNVTSEYRLEPAILGAGNENRFVNIDTDEVSNTADDHRALLITPDLLIDYPFPTSSDDYKPLAFQHSQTLLNGDSNLSGDGCSVSIYPGETDMYFPTKYIVTASKTNSETNSFNVRFLIRYSEPGEGGTKDSTVAVTLTFETYGGYSIKFAPINGKKAVTYNTLNSDVFARMSKRGYTLQKVESNNLDILEATLVNNIIVKLAPNVDNIKGQAHTTVKLTFIDSRNRTITFDSDDISINVNAGSLFSQFEDWQAWLIIAAVALGIIIIILLIVWLFIHSISKHKQEEAASQAPVSSYIVKLNSTIAATQAQQRAAQTQALSQASTQMLLGAGPTGTPAAPPDTLQLASGMASTPSSYSTPGGPAMSEPMASIPPDGEDYNALIAKYISDEELLERIFREKYEPKGMVRRTFFKSKDLQTRELEKEKRRIIDRYKQPMPMDEAIMSENEISSSVRTSTPGSTPEAESEPQQEELFVLDFDPDSPLYEEAEPPAPPAEDASPEQTKVDSLEYRYNILTKELEELRSRLEKVQAELDHGKTLEQELRDKIAKAEEDDAQYKKDIEELEFKLASAKRGDKDRITRDIGIKEEKKQRNLDDLEKLRAELANVLGGTERIGLIYTKLSETQTTKTNEQNTVSSDLQKAQKELDAYLERLRKVQARQELDAKVTSLTPLLQEVNKTDYELRDLQNQTDKLDKERESLKAAVAAAKSQILGATDFGLIGELNTQISDSNARLSEIDREVTGITKRRSTLNIDFNAQRRKANEFCEQNDIPVEEVIKAEDVVIGNIELEIIKAARERDKDDAEKAVAAAQAVYDDLCNSANDVTLIAMDVAAGIKDIEEEIETVQNELAEVNAQMETASDDERLMLMVEQGDKTDKIEELKAKLEQANVDGTKRKMEAQADYDSKLEQARAEIDRTNADFDRAVEAYDTLVNSTNPVDLIISGSGVISQDQKKIEAENLKKQLERSKNEIEQARLAAQMAQEQAEEARRKAEEDAEAARLEAERTAQEAIERAEKARLEAEEKARSEVEAAEQARLEAEQQLAVEAEEARRRMEEESEEAKRRAIEEAEEARRQAQEEADEAKRKAQEEADEANRKAQEEIESMRRKAEEEAEAKRLEEENKRKEEEERRKADEAKNEAIAKKIAMRKEQIIAIRNEMKELKDEEGAKNLRERLYNIQLTYDEDEHGSTELMDFYNKTMDDIQHAGEVARLKAENAKKPQRIVRKVTERVNRIPKRRPGQRPGARPGARPAARPGARPAGARPGARPAARPGARPAGARPGARPAARPGARPNRPR